MPLPDILQPRFIAGVVRDYTSDLLTYAAGRLNPDLLASPEPPLPTLTRAEMAATKYRTAQIEQLKGQYSIGLFHAAVQLQMAGGVEAVGVNTDALRASQNLANYTAGLLSHGVPEEHVAQLMQTAQVSTAEIQRLSAKTLLGAIGTENLVQALLNGKSPEQIVNEGALAFVQTVVKQSQR